jgi:transglutaminase-like putative cysteine protease
MARPQGSSPRTQRLIAVLATCAVAVATAFAFGRVFLGHASTWRLMAVALTSAVVACALERRSLVLATLVSAAMLVVVIGMLVFPSTTWHGLPTLETLRRALGASRLIGEQARLQVAPTAPLRPLMLAAIVAIWAAIFSCHALAFRAGSPLLALLPPVALLAFADTVLEELTKPVYGVVFVAAALLIVFADALRRVQGWGPVWVGPGSRARLSATASRGARRVAVAVVATAALVPVVVPGFGSKAIIDLSTTAAADRVRIDPLVRVGASLARRDPVEVFQVTSNVPSYWRMLSLPTFDGREWRPDTTTAGDPVTAGQDLSSGVVGIGTIDQTFRVSTDLSLQGLPMAYPPQRIDVSATDVRYNGDTGTATPGEGLDAGAVYHVTSVEMQPPPAELAAVVFPTQAQNPRYTTLPDDDTIAQIRQIAEQWTAGATNDYQRILAIQDHLNDTSVFTYDANVPQRDDSYTLVDFLTTTRRGFCQQFASAMAVMLRSIGLPARVAVGFTAGAYDPATNTRHVTTQDAHAWVEVLFPTYGWLAFEPTPGRTNPVATGYQHPSAACAAGAAACAAPGGAGGAGGAGAGAGNPSGLPQQLLNAIRRETTPVGRRGHSPFSNVPLTPAPRRLPYGAIALAILGLALVAALVVPPARALRRRVRLRRAARTPRALILATYDVFTGRAADLGYPRGRGETLEEYRRRLGESQTLRDGHLERLTTAAGRAAYAADDPGDEEAQEASEAASAAFRDLRDRTSLRRRIAGQYRLWD